MKLLLLMTFFIFISCGKSEEANPSRVSLNFLKVTQEKNLKLKVSKYGYEFKNNQLNYSYILLVIDSKSKILDYKFTKKSDPNFNSQIQNEAKIFTGHLNWAAMPNMIHLERHQKELNGLNYFNGIRNIYAFGKGLTYIYVEDFTNPLGNRNDPVTLNLLLENDISVNYSF